MAANEEGAGLAVWVSFATDVPTTAEIAIDDGMERRVQPVEVEASEHHVFVLGLRPDQEHVFTVTATAAGGRSAAADPVTFYADPLPVEIAPFAFTSRPERMEPGLTLLTLGKYMVMLDAMGEVVWYLDRPEGIRELILSARDTVLFQLGRYTLREVRLNGEMVGEWVATHPSYPAPAGAVVVDVEAFHHGIAETTDGNLLALSVERRLLADYPTSEHDPEAPRAEAWVAGDVVVELARDGTLVNTWSLLDRLDPYRIAYDGLTGDYWEGFYPGDVKDWGHGNAIAYDPGRDEVVVSLRHQDAVVALERMTGDVAWVFAPDANWDASGVSIPLLLPAEAGSLPAYHQHGAGIGPDGTLVLFDNGNRRASAFETPLPDEQNFSRALEVRVDPESGTWHHVWEWGAELDPSHYSGSFGDADVLPTTGNVLITFGNVKSPSLPAYRLVEVTRDGEVVFDLSYAGPESFRPTLFCAERIPGHVVPGR